jgi:ferrous iron transport protein B
MPPMSATLEAPSRPRLKHVALAGNPNCGKTTLFNALTGLRQKVGNYPGVTVEKKVGRFHGSHGEPMELLDLPGTYSLQNRSPDEEIACDVLFGRREDTPEPDVIVVVLDATNLERNLYLAAQIFELHKPVVIALNMIDLAEAKQIRIDIDAMQKALGVPVIPTVASTGSGVIALRQALSRTDLRAPVAHAPMPEEIEAELEDLISALTADHPEGRAASRAEAILCLSLPERGDDGSRYSPDVIAQVQEGQARIRAAGEDPMAAAVEARYAWANEIVTQCVRRSTGEHVFTWSDRLDMVLTHRLWGWLLFLAVLGFMFFSIFTVAQYPMNWIDAGTAAAADWIGSWMPEGDLRSLLNDGVIAGVGGVVVFLPQILILFFFIGLLEDTGYMARAAFIMDRLMSKVGLHGKSFIPLLSSFACAIPGIMATRTIENPKDRLATILIAPLMSCSARLPVYGLLIAAMFPSREVSAWIKAGIMLAMYLVGIGAAFGTAWLFKRTLLKGETPMLLLELPPYRVPVLQSVAMQMWQRSGIFLRRAGTVILALSIVLWALATYPKHPDPKATPSEALSYSAVGRLGHAMEPAIAPLGYDWKIGVGLVASFAAREVFVGTMAIIHNIANEEDQGLLQAVETDRWPDGRPVFTPLVCVSLMVFYVLALQCVSTVAIVRRETNSWRWPLFQIGYMTALAYLGALVVYQGGRFLGF